MTVAGDYETPTRGAVQRVALGVAYDGSPWRGWQTQPDGQTIQDQFEAALEAFAGQRLATICAGRTDTGVHALNQVVHVDAPFERAQHAWVRGLNRYLPDTIAVQWAQPVSDAFHARFSAQTRRYTYLILNAPTRHPMWQTRAGWCFRSLDENAMQHAADVLLGKHDFSSYRASECQAASPVRTLNQLQITRYGAFVVLQFEANAFLHHMVRNIVGELVYVGQGRRQLSAFKKVFEAQDRTLAAPTYSAAGLYLTDVSYPTELLSMPSQSGLWSPILGWGIGDFVAI